MKSEESKEVVTQALIAEDPNSKSPTSAAIKNRLRRESMLPFSLVFAHGLLFFVQCIVFTCCNAIFFELFVETHALTPAQENLTPTYVGYFTGSFFVGKIISDFFWGYVRDTIGDKKSIYATSVLIAICLILMGFSWNLLSLLIFSGLLGLSCGLFVPGLTFCNWIEPEKRNALVMWIYIFAGAGSLTGPFLGSMLFSVYTTHKLPKATITIGCLMLVALLNFNYAFSDMDDKGLIDRSKYSELIEYQNQAIRRASQIRASIIEPPSNVKETPESKFERKDSSMTDELRFIEGRKKMSNLSAWESMKVNNARPALIISCGIVWGVRLMEFILFPLWTELDKKDGGLGFTTVQAGSITLLNFPIMALLLMYLYKTVQNFKSSYVLSITTLVMVMIAGLTPLIAFLPLSMEPAYFIVVCLTSMKEVANILFLSSWSTLFSKLIPSRTLGKVFSWAFMIGHLILAGLTQVYPRLMTVFIADQRIISYFGKFRMVAFFSIMAAPMLLVPILISYAKRVLFKREEIFI